ncbi:MAG: menaquinone biosynthesis family protein [Candidatus Kapaibacterium sp.]
MITLRLAYSPDADDAFMFRAAIEGLIDTEGLTFQPVTDDTQSLNDLALSGRVDVTAISVAAWPLIAEHYLLLPHGGSVGRGYGPVIVATEERGVSELNGMRLATPGNRTTAHLVTKLIAPEAEMTPVPITPYEAIFEAIESGDVDAGVIIHEGRLTYAAHGLKKIVDLGEWWMERTGLPLPLGANVIRRDLGGDLIERASRVLQRSIGYALEHRDEMIEFLIDHVHRPEEVATPELLDTYLGMYANQETYAYSEDTREGMQLLLDHGYEAGLIEQHVVVEFA